MAEFFAFFRLTCIPILAVQPSPAGHGLREPVRSMKSQQGIPPIFPRYTQLSQCLLIIVSHPSISVPAHSSDSVVSDFRTAIV